MSAGPARPGLPGTQTRLIAAGLEAAIGLGCQQVYGRRPHEGEGIVLVAGAGGAEGMYVINRRTDAEVPAG